MEPGSESGVACGFLLSGDLLEVGSCFLEGLEPALVGVGVRAEAGAEEANGEETALSLAALFAV